MVLFPRHIPLIAAEEFLFPARASGVKNGMFTRFLPAAALAAIAAILLVVLAPTGAAAHAGHAHMAGPAPVAPQNIPVAAVKDDDTTHAIRAELKAPTPAPAGTSFEWTCGDRGCCGSGHCSACGNVITPSCSIDLALSIGTALSSHNAAVPSAPADEGPPRPPKTFA